MALQDKYKELIQYVNGHGVTDLSVAEQGGILYVTCTAPNNKIKEEIWKLYENADPDMRSGDMVLNVAIDSSSTQTYEVKAGDNLTKIAKNYTGISWEDIYEANRDQLKDPDKIFPGQVLKIPV
jgi:nucleoid-associated protein YgaU